MGNVSSSEINGSTKTTGESIITLSDQCLQRLTRQHSSESLETEIPISDKEWMMKLKCLDEAHSGLEGITIEYVNEMIEKIVGELEDMRPIICPTDQVIDCLKKPPQGTIKCKALMDAYIDCIDKYRINIIKERIEYELKEKRKQDQNAVKQFLKN